MPLRYKCRHCQTEMGQLPLDAKETVKKLQLYEFGEIDDYIDFDSNGVPTVHCICEQCETSLKQFPHYYSLKKWLQ